MALLLLLAACAPSVSAPPEAGTPETQASQPVETPQPTILTECEADSLVAGVQSETVYSWGGNQDSWYALRQASSVYYPTPENLDEAEKAAFIENYLQERGMDVSAPDDVMLNVQGLPLAEYYYDGSTGTYCFVVHVWREYQPVWGADTWVSADTVCCMTVEMDDPACAGQLLTAYDAESSVTRERLYDAGGGR